MYLSLKHGPEKGGFKMMNYDRQGMSSMLAEDVNAPELRNPLNSGMRREGWLRRLFRKVL